MGKELRKECWKGCEESVGKKLRKECWKGCEERGTEMLERK